jgi:hypothetical protein
MIGSPWDTILTIAFSFTAIVCLRVLVQHRTGSRSRHEGLTDMGLIHLNHGLMSIAMIVMVWVYVIDAVTWAQVALFGVLALSLIPLFGRTKKLAGKVDLVGHIVMDVAMIWMLAAMPLLMAGVMGGESDSAHAGHHGGVTGEMISATPVWADLVNMMFIIASAAATLWWLWRFFAVRGHRLHSLCHTVMAAGMGLMLFLMNV